VLVWGAPGIGKTALVLKVLSSLPERVARSCFYVTAPKSRRDLLAQLIGCLYQQVKTKLTYTDYPLSELRRKMGDPGAGGEASENPAGKGTSQ
jgi:Cdc6-like AAA superfamily ATPase